MLSIVNLPNTLVPNDSIPLKKILEVDDVHAQDHFVMHFTCTWRSYDLPVAAFAMVSIIHWCASGSLHGMIIGHSTPSTSTLTAAISVAPSLEVKKPQASSAWLKNWSAVSHWERGVGSAPSSLFWRKKWRMMLVFGAGSGIALLLEGREKGETGEIGI